MLELPLKGLIVLDFSQYLAGPAASLRLADLGARVIKIEQPGKGDAGRKLAIKDIWVDDNSLLFHTINRNKESFTANLKDKNELEIVKKLIAKADVLINNFRPGIMTRIGLSYEAVQEINPKMIYASISGYGNYGVWKNKPGQDLLLQSITGLAYTTGNADNNPVPFGISVGDIICGAQLVQGILAGLIRRQKKGIGALIEISLMESLLDFQFELLTTYFANKKQPERSQINNAQPLLGAPYGIYKTKDGFLALAMMDLQVLAKTIGCTDLEIFSQDEAFKKRDTIKEILSIHLLTQNTNFWLSKLQANGLWANEVLDWDKMVEQEAYKILDMEQTIKTRTKDITTTRCPIRINDSLLVSEKPAPQLGEHTEKIKKELLGIAI